MAAMASILSHLPPFFSGQECLEREWVCGFCSRERKIESFLDLQRKFSKKIKKIFKKQRKNQCGYFLFLLWVRERERVCVCVF
ncbi:hypothetical protein Hanom_Chr07g00660301 [Helianthus anomalus]